MTFPNAKIEIYDTDDDLIHIITSDILQVNVTPVVTSQIGMFSFMLPGRKATSYVYNDIGNNYMAKIYLGYGTLDADDLQLVGKILRIDSTKELKGGFYRIFSGKDLGEILERRLKTNIRWEGHTAAYIVIQCATELGIYNATKIGAGAVDEIITVRTESYLDLLKIISDYWYDGSTKVQKDFYVDTENELVWKSRPLRTIGVTPLTASGVNANILCYRLVYDITPVKNRITVYGAPSAYLPNDKDSYTESLTDWTASAGSLTLASTTPSPKAGSYYIKCSNAVSPYNCIFKRTLPQINLRDINKLNFWYAPEGPASGTTKVIRLLAPDSSNYFQADLTAYPANWYWANFTLGDNAVYDVDENPSGIWSKTGNPNWWNIQYFELSSTGNTFNVSFSVDKLYFSPYRWMGIAPNPDDEPTTSQTIYGLREAEFTDENLLSNAECEKRAFTLLTQLGERTLGLEVALQGNTNIKIGDRLPVTLPADNISAINFDVVSATHSYQKKPLGLRTNASLIYDANTRTFPPRTPVESVQRKLAHLSAVTSELYSRVVR